MSVPVIDPLHVVDIQEQHTDIESPRIDVLKDALRHAVVPEPVVQAGQLIPHIQGVQLPVQHVRAKPVARIFKGKDTQVHDVLMQVHLSDGRRLRQDQESQVGVLEMQGIKDRQLLIAKQRCVHKILPRYPHIRVRLLMLQLPSSAAGQDKGIGEMPFV